MKAHLRYSPVYCLKIFYLQLSTGKATYIALSVISREGLLIHLKVGTSQWAHGATMTSYRRECDVVTSHRR